jgi:hypothetical protein
LVLAFAAQIGIPLLANARMWETLEKLKLLIFIIISNLKHNS